MAERIIIADDHPIFRDGMRRILQRAVPEAVLSEVGTAEELMRTAADGEPAGMLVLDLVFPGFEGPDSIRALRRQAEATRDEAMDRARRQLAQGKDPTTVLEMLAHTLTNKFLHVPCTGLREAAAEGDAAMLNLIKTLYRLGDGDPRR